LIPLKNKFKNYKGVIYVRRLRGPPINQKIYDKYVANKLGTNFASVCDFLACYNSNQNTALIPLNFMVLPRLHDLTIFRKIIFMDLEECGFALN
jgi:hypothetical protein